MFVSSTGQNIEWTAIPTSALRMTNIQILTETLEKRCFQQNQPGVSHEHDYTAKGKEVQVIESSAAAPIEVLEGCEVSDNTHHVTISSDGTIELGAPRAKRIKKDHQENMQEASEDIPLTVEVSNGVTKRKGNLLPDWWWEFQRKLKDRRSNQSKQQQKSQENEQVQDEVPAAAAPTTNNEVNQEVLDDPLCSEDEDEDVSRTYLPDWWTDFQTLKQQRKKEETERRKARLRNIQEEVTTSNKTVDVHENSNYMGQEEANATEKMLQEACTDVVEELSDDEEDILLYMEDFLPEWWLEFQKKCRERRKQQNKQNQAKEQIDPVSKNQDEVSPPTVPKISTKDASTSTTPESESDVNTQELKTKLKDLETENNILRKENEAFRKMIIELEEENEMLRENILS